VTFRLSPSICWRSGVLNILFGRIERLSVCGQRSRLPAAQDDSLGQKSSQVMTVIVIRDRNVRLEEARVAATVLCALGIVHHQPPSGLPFREIGAYEGSLEIACDSADIASVKAAFVAAGFSVLGSD
jgi:hypothetical protein